MLDPSRPGHHVPPDRLGSSTARPASQAASGDLLRRIGGARGRVFALLASEIAAVVLASLVLAGALTALVSYKAEALFRAFFL